MDCSRKVTTAWEAWQQHAQNDISRFESALQNPEAAQFSLLESILSQASETAWARHNCIPPGITPAEFRECYPVQDPSDYVSWTERIRSGEANVLTNASVERLVPTSGSTGPHKLIPMTKASRQEFHSAVNIWIGGLMRTHPDILCGRLYLATSPSLSLPYLQNQVPVEYADDSAYLHPEIAESVASLSVASPGFSKLRGEAWKQATRKALLNTRDLSFISLWHPSYLLALFTERELEQLSRQWNHLSVVSTWSDGACSAAADALMHYFPQSIHSPKGLWLTEGVVSIPWEGAYPAALNSSFIEFECRDGSLQMAHEIKAGETYRPVITNHTGLYRYRTGDLIEVTGFIQSTPSIRFLGRADKVSDLCGEKLSEAQVELAFQEAGITGEGVLAPNKEKTIPNYTCILPQEDDIPPEVATRLENSLMKNPHYAWARMLGQLRPVSVRYLSGSEIRERSLCQEKSDQKHIKGTRLFG